MKNLVLGIVFCAAMIGCKKETKIAENTVNSEADSVIVPESYENSEPAASFKEIEFSVDKTAKFLAKQNNDTLYVNNFFATWCGPCIREIPHFKEKMEELKSQPVKFTFISLDAKKDWSGAVKDFAEQQNIAQNVVLLDGETLSPEFFGQNFKTWDGGSIPFTLMRKGDKTDETVGMMSPEMLTQKIESFK